MNPDHPRRARVPRAWATGAGAVLLAAALEPAAAQQLNFRQYTSVDGLPQRQVLALLQDSDGYLWFGTYGGLSRYNGQRIETFTTGDGLTANVIRDLAEDAAGRLVIATRGGGVCIRGDEGFECLTSRDRVIDGDVIDLEPDREGGLWIATAAGLTHWSAAGAVRHYTEREGLPSVVCNRVVQDGEGTIWVGTLGGLARLARHGRFEPVVDARLDGRPVQMLLPTPDGLWVGAESGLFLWARERLEPVPLPSGFEGAVFSDGARDASGAVWLTSPRGVLVYEAGRFRTVTQANGLLSDVTHRVLIDHERTIWFGTEAGLSKLAPGPFETYGVGDGLPHSFVRALAEDAGGGLWIGTRGGGLAIMDSEPRVPGAAEGQVAVARGRGPGARRLFSSLGTAAGLPSDQVYALISAGDGRMLVGTSEGLALVDGEVRRVYRRADGLPGDGIRSLVRAPDGGFWVGTTGGLAHWEEGRITSYPHLPVISEANVIAMEVDLRGRLWLGLAAGGVAVVDGGEVIRLGRADGLTDQTVWALDRDLEGRIWIGSNGNGAFRVGEDGEVRQFTTADGLVDDFVWQVLCDSAGQVWLYTSRGLDRFDGDRFVHYDEGDGLFDLEGSANAAWEDSRGVLWFGNASGLVRHDRSREIANPVPPPVIVDGETSGAGRRIRPGDRIARHSGALGFRFASLSFRHEGSVRYRYRLLGLSEIWSQPGPEAGITFGNLGPGAYVLQVLGSNDDGVWSPEPATIAFTMAPAFWQTWWFRLAALAALAAAVALLVVLRTRNLEAARRLLEAIVAQRTAELERTNALLAEMAKVDELTQLHNRRCFLEVLDLELRRLTREGPSSAACLMMLDVDHFKGINDRYGHVVGDRLLAAVARRLEATVRSTDFVARYGGEEFAAILRSTRIDGARVLGAKILAAVADRPFAVDEVAIPCTISIGISEISRLVRFDESVPRRLVSEADHALYRAKAAGRNRLAVHAGREASGSDAETSAHAVRRERPGSRSSVAEAGGVDTPPALGSPLCEAQ